ncbi:MAG: hypothetical protein WD048_06755 [Chitinophagales bacterium]
MSKLDEKKNLNAHLIEKYREMVRKRYDYERLAENYDLPRGINRELVQTVRNYFLMVMYPSIEVREELDEAFTYLSSYVRHPTKVFKLIGSMSSAVFTFGFQLPRALRAGMLSLEAFLNTKKFEGRIKESIVEIGMKVPISDEDYRHAMAAIPENEAKKFLRDIEHLLEFLTDTSLLKKTVEVMETVVLKMEKNPETFSQEEVSGIQLGIEIMNNGYVVFEDMDRRTKKNMIQLISKVERDFMETVYDKN